MIIRAFEPLSRPCVSLDDRGVLLLTGSDRVAFLQGLLSNDLTQVNAGNSIYATLLTPQGKFLHDLFVSELGEAVVLDVDRARRNDLLARLRRYRLRAKVEITDLTDEMVVLALVGGSPAVAGSTEGYQGGLAVVDPRSAALGGRLVVPRALRDMATASRALYDRLRLDLGVPDAAQDLVVEKSSLLENNLDVFNAISWTKGCYVGQEVIARTRYRGLVRRRLRPVQVDGPLPPPGTPVCCGGQEVGELRSGCGSVALALLPLEVPEGLTAGGITLTPFSPISEHP